MNRFVGFAVAESQSTALPPLEERPLVTFALLAYNQEDWVRDAVEGALAQDYPNLEIILSDDASTDRTWEVVREAVAGYRNKHRVILNRNKMNLGLCGHVNAIFERASGELIVLAAGDDVSFTHRVSTLVSEWLKHGKPEAVLHSAAEVLKMGSELKTIRQPPTDRLRNLSIDDYVNRGLKSPILGATAAYTPGIYRSFGPLDEAGSIEDGPMVFRALLIGAKFFHIESPLVMYRFTGENISSPLARKNPKRTMRYLRACQFSVKQHARDFEVSSTYFSHLQRHIEVEYERLVASENILAQDPLSIIRGLLAYTRGLRLTDRAYIIKGFFGLEDNYLIRLISCLRRRIVRVFDIIKNSKVVS